MHCPSKQNFWPLHLVTAEHFTCPGCLSGLPGYPGFGYSSPMGIGLPGYPGLGYGSAICEGLNLNSNCLPGYPKVDFLFLQ